MRSFPTVYWRSWNCDATFLPGTNLTDEIVRTLYAVLVFAYYAESMVMADIQGRGLCIPSGRILPGEAIDQTAIRETMEETGAELHTEQLHLIGFYRMRARDGVQSDSYSAVYIAEAVAFHPIPADSESNGYYLIAPEDVADQYFMWDDLLAEVFQYAAEQRALLNSSADQSPSSNRRLRLLRAAAIRIAG